MGAASLKTPFAQGDMFFDAVGTHFERVIVFIQSTFKLSSDQLQRPISIALETREELPFIRPLPPRA